MSGNLATVDAVYKDAHPMDTVDKIKEILRQNGIETVEQWMESDVPNCYSLRVNIVGTKVGTNGKGVTKEFALASGYGEFMERIQIGNIWRNKMSFEKGVSSGDAQSTYVPAEELLNRNGEWYKKYAGRLYEMTGVSMTPKQIIDQHMEKDGTVLAAPYYCATTNTVEHLPFAMVKSVYGSNGGAAGNTMEEAVVQAISEIVERNHEMRIIYEKIAVPDIPESVLQGCPIAYDTIQFLRENGYRVMVKDCSLGTKFPVVCVCIINTANGKYHTHFGAHPNFEVALQRTLTESFQGRNIKNIAKFGDFCYKEEDMHNFRHLLFELVKGTSEKTPRFFINKAEENGGAAMGFAGGNNRQCLQECIAFFREQGYDVLVRDCSCLGFPACQVIIPGYSEVTPHRVSVKYDNYRYRTQATRALRNPTAVGPQDMLALMMHTIESQKFRVYGMESFLTEAGITALISKEEDAYLMDAAMAYVSYSLGDTAKTVEHINKMLGQENARDEGYLVCLKRYLSMKKHGYTQEEIRQLLTDFHNEETVKRLYDCLDGGQNPFHCLVLRCDQKCSPDCRLYGRCKKKYTDRIAQVIVEKSKQIDQADLAKVFENM